MCVLCVAEIKYVCNVATTINPTIAEKTIAHLTNVDMIKSTSTAFGLYCHDTVIESDVTASSCAG